MNGWRLPLALAILALAGPQASAQETVQQAREEGKALAAEKRADASLVPTDEAQARVVPGYAGVTTSQSTYFDDPDRLVSNASAAAGTSDSYRTVTDPQRRRPTFSAAEIRATTARATAVEQDPAAFLAGQSMTSSTGSCVPLPPGSSGQGYYEATCNSGTKVEERPQTCTIRMVPEVVSTLRYFYYGVPANKTGYGFASQDYLNAKASAGVCRPTGVSPHICDAQIELGAGGSDVEAYRRYCKKNVSGTATQFSCSAELPAAELAQHFNYATGTNYLKKEGESSVTVRRDESGCSGYASDAMCASTTEVCTEGPETRVIEGVPVTQACWAWRRDYMCRVLSPASDCADLENKRQCTFLREECLDDPQMGACKVTEKIYRCPTPGGATPADKQYICGNDVYCINGDCEPIVREASTEFKDALVALHSIDQAGKEFDPNNLLVFSGERDTCHKPVFGLVNCCAGKTSGLLTAAAGGAALAGGPAAIAALATPFLSLFLCSQDEMRLDIKDRMGFCHKVGTWCSSSFLGICTSKRTAYCCFESKLSRILQEQGRAQIGKSWDSPKRESCKGFTIDEFARLDLSKMDFTEIYAEFIDAAKLPDEVQTINDIQTKIRGYYELHGALRGG